MTAAGAAISGQVTLRQVQARGRVRGVTALLGPAFVASVAYVDPGNFATNFAGGAGHGYELAWVIVMASLMAMLVQYLTAKAGLVTGRSLPELCRGRFGRRASVLLWLQAKAVAIIGATVMPHVVYLHSALRKDRVRAAPRSRPASR